MSRRDKEVSQLGVRGHPSGVVNGRNFIKGSVAKIVFELSDIGWWQIITEKARVEGIGQNVRYTIHELEEGSCELRKHRRSSWVMTSQS